MVDFLERRGFRGLNIGLKTLLALLFADDAAFFAASFIEAKKMLAALAEYFDENKLTVHTGKTQVMVYHASRRVRKKEKRAFYYKNQLIKTTNRYNYLETTFDTATKGELAAAAALRKAKIATGTTCSVLFRAKSDSWQSRMHLFNNIVAPTILYGAEIWSLDHMDTIDKAQTDFFKKILLLPSNTPGYMIRLETGITRLSVNAFNHTWSWIICILKMGDNRWLKISLLNQIELSKNPQCQVKFNWVAKFIYILKETKKMFSNLDPNF